MKMESANFCETSPRSENGTVVCLILSHLVHFQRNVFSLHVIKLELLVQGNLRFS
jgi:hypothetical protein